jgi:hypothetical protein
MYRKRYSRFGTLESVIPEYTLRIHKLIVREFDNRAKQMENVEILTKVIKFRYLENKQMFQRDTEATEKFMIYLHSILKNALLLFHFTDRFQDIELKSVRITIPTGNEVSQVNEKIIVYPRSFTQNSPFINRKLIQGMFTSLYHCFNVNTFNYCISILLKKIKYLKFNNRIFENLIAKLIESYGKKHQDQVLDMFRLYTLSLDPESLRRPYEPEIHTGRRTLMDDNVIREISFYKSYWQDEHMYAVLILYLENYNIFSDPNGVSILENFVDFIAGMASVGTLNETAFDVFLWVVCNLINLPNINPRLADVPITYMTEQLPTEVIKATEVVEEILTEASRLRF